MASETALPSATGTVPGSSGLKAATRGGGLEVRVGFKVLKIDTEKDEVKAGTD